MRDIFAIIGRNFRQPIVIGILILAITLLVLGERRDAWFVSFIIIINTLFAIVQEIRARHALRKLELMSRPRARRINSDGTVDDIPYADLIVGDRIDVRLGDEVPADGSVVSSKGLEVDESMLTGESVAIQKEATHPVYASSSIVAGSAIVDVVAVGQDTRVGSMTAQLKRYHPQPTPLQRVIAKTIIIMTYGALALAVLIFVVYFVAGEDPVKIVKTITSAAVTVVPEGLLLASTLLLAFGSLRLAQAKVLPQKLSAIEAMALLDVLCVDKTGTLTSDDIKFDSFEVADDSDKDVLPYIGATVLETGSGNATGDAMIAGLPAPDKYVIEERLAFSSIRKYSGARVTINNKTRSILVGAPEFLAVYARGSHLEQEIRAYTEKGQRALLVVEIDHSSTPLAALKEKSGRAVGVVVLSNELRAGVSSTVAYLQSKNVAVKVISGDSLNTVRSVAESVGIHNAQQAITGEELRAIPRKKWSTALHDVAVFARVLPEQKEQLVTFFQKQGHFTGMIGDGVNDALALKKADLGIAMFAGAAASRRIADMVLLNNSFNAMPLGMRLGNRIMLSIEMIATLFFHKIIYGVILLISTMVLGIVYPFEPRHVTFMNIFLVTTPTVLWTLFPPVPTYTISPKRFWRETLLPVVPIAALSGAAVALSYVQMQKVHPDDPAGVVTTSVLIATFFGVYLVFLVGRLFRTRMTRVIKLSRILYMLIVLFVVIVSFGFGFTRDFFDFTAPAWRDLWPLGIMILLTATIQWIVVELFARHRKSPLPRK